MSPNRPPQIVFERLGIGSWRLCDQAAPARDARHVIAYVERTDDDRYAVTWVSYRSGTRTFGSHREILQAAAQRTAPKAGRPDAKPIPLPHLPPLSAW